MQMDNLGRMDTNFLPFCLCLLLVCGLHYSEGYRILGFHPIPAVSQQNVFAPILYELARRGHQVVYVTPVRPSFIHPNLEIRLIEPFTRIFHTKVDLAAVSSAPPHKGANRLFKTGYDSVNYLYGNPVSQALIHSTESFDAVTMESYFIQEPVSALLHKFGCPAIEISTLGAASWLNELSGLPSNPSYQIDFRSKMTDNMSFLERFYNAYVIWSTVAQGYYYLPKMQEAMDKYFNYTGWQTRPPLRTLLANRSIVLINQDIALGYPYPTAPHVKSIGGINVIPNQPLPKDIQKFMDDAEYGVIYFSLGSNLKTSELMESEFGKPFLAAFQNLPQKIIMKWEEPNIAIPLPKNVMTYKWVPQQDVLAHKNCKMFITHGGFLSITEAAYHGVPILGIPVFGDQPTNMVQVESAGFGISISVPNVTSTSLSWGINEILSNPRYKMESVRRSEMLKGRRHTPLEDAVYWIEHAIKHPNSLTPRSVYLSNIQLHMIDIKLCMLLFMLTPLALIFYIFSRLSKGKEKKKLE